MRLWFQLWRTPGRRDEWMHLLSVKEVPLHSRLMEIMVARNHLAKSYHHLVRAFSCFTSTNDLNSCRSSALCWWLVSLVCNEMRFLCLQVPSLLSLFIRFCLSQKKHGTDNESCLRTASHMLHLSSPLLTAHREKVCTDDVHWICLRITGCTIFYSVLFLQRLL